MFGDVPFCAVQLLNYGGYGCDGYPAIRQQQLDAFYTFDTNAAAKNTFGLISLIDQKYANPYQQNTGLHPEGKREADLRIAK